MIRYFKNIISGNLRIEDAHSYAPEGSAGRAPHKNRVLIIAVTVCLSLIFIEYFGKEEGGTTLVSILRWLGLQPLSEATATLLQRHPDRQLFSLAYWVFVIVICYMFLPMLVIKLVFREKIRDYGFSAAGLFKEYRLFLLFFAIMIPLVWFFSRTEGFQYRYPFYRMQAGQDLWPKFWIWQALYLLQFVALEFFFRGFMVHGLKSRLGFNSVLVMTIPYCMIHFGKPMPETIAAIVAGLVLGTLSLRSRTIWMGVAIHYTVALSMDFSALWQKGFWGI